MFLSLRLMYFLLDTSDFFRRREDDLVKYKTSYFSRAQLLTVVKVKQRQFNDREITKRASYTGRLLVGTVELLYFIVVLLL